VSQHRRQLYLTRPGPDADVGASEATTVGAGAVGR
jgi:hypothetical protein